MSLCVLVDIGDLYRGPPIPHGRMLAVPITPATTHGQVEASLLRAAKDLDEHEAVRVWFRYTNTGEPFDPDEGQWPPPEVVVKAFFLLTE